MAVEYFSALRPAVVSSLPVSASQGDTVVLSTDGHLYTYNGTTWVDNANPWTTVTVTVASPTFIATQAFAQAGATVGANVIANIVGYDDELDMEPLIVYAYVVTVNFVTIVLKPAAEGHLFMGNRKVSYMIV